MHNSISVDGSVRDFKLDKDLHHEIADKTHADAHLIGSETAKTGIEMLSEKVPPEEPQDFVKPVFKPDDAKPYYVLSDSKGKLKGTIHVYRRQCYCKDIIVLVTEKTPVDYIEYLKQRTAISSLPASKL